MSKCKVENSAHVLSNFEIKFLSGSVITFCCCAFQGVVASVLACVTDRVPTFSPDFGRGLASQSQKVGISEAVDVGTGVGK
jgi:hypothetical protein